eukprot:TRINITY_DN1725_c0_g3_i1.p1 TRINITY_DN1725_c0_g3~~TRINITY_DN1725_c0_g3_i1.p1  ORF type:complete len:315 (-),score=79.37 TRINITY_DN1725_c0_g3_i1:37-981(-)
MDSECEEMKYEEKGGLYYDLEPDVVYTVADEADIEDLEDEDNNEPLRPPPMQQRMEKIQSMQIARREMISEYYVPRHPTLFTLSEDKFVPSFVEAITTGSEHALQSILTKETEDTMIYSLEIFNKDFCDKLLEEVEHFEGFGLPILRPNSMNNYGLILDEIGFTDFFEQLREKYILPITSVLYPGDWGGDSLDSHHAFIVQYKLTEDKKLDFHYDDSEVTINLCLGKQFKGGNLYFKGLYHKPETHNENFEYDHKIGRALLHIGKHRHGANSITEGERYNMIVWFRSSKVRTQQMSCHCSEEGDHHHHHHHTNE